MLSTPSLIAWGLYEVVEPVQPSWGERGSSDVAGQGGHLHGGGGDLEPSSELLLGEEYVPGQETAA